MSESRPAYPTLIANLPPGLDRAILRALQFRQGRNNAIGRGDLLKAVKAQGFTAHERQLREAIKGLRRQGNLIGSAAGEEGGYYLITSFEEFEDFDRAEFEAKITDMAETRAAMRRAAQEKWTLQERLF